MRRYVEEILWPAGYEVDYVEFHHMETSSDIINKLSHFDEILYFDLTDDILQRRLDTALAELSNNPKVKRLESPNFYLTISELKNFFADKKKAQFLEFYQWQRERFNILINKETYKPLGGKLIFDDAPKRLPKNHELPSFQVYGSNKYVSEAKDYVNHYFSNNPGDLEDFPWPTSHKEASEWLDEFLEHRLENFGVYQDAIDGQAPWLYHSALSTTLNAGLLDPTDVVRRAVNRHEQNPVPMQSIESFVRQILGWREYMRGVYIDRQVSLRTSNVFGHNRKLTNDWYYGTTGLLPVDDVIKKTFRRGYAHNVERLMVVGNIMFLCDFHPSEVYRWFMEMFTDSYDWVLVPNVYGISQYSDGGSMITRPHVSSSNYILKMSHYEQEDWCDVWDGLYWRFIDKNKDRFLKNPKMAIVVKQYEKMSENRKRIISYRAEDFLNTKTTS
jgi:deoxyribodipyrimidine photolyase-related protein